MIIFYLVNLLLLPLTMIGFGLMWRGKHWPKKINPILGYRTSRSMRSQATWEFAHRYVGGIWLYVGLPIGLLSLALLFAFKNLSKDELGRVVLILTYLQIASLLLPIIPTEVALKKRFDERGNPRRLS